MGCCLVCPQKVEQLLDPVTLGTVQSSLQSIQDCLVNGFGLPIALRICWGRVPIHDAQITAKIAEGPAIKLQPIIGDEGVWYSKSCNYILPYELFDINIPNVG